MLSSEGFYLAAILNAVFQIGLLLFSRRSNHRANWFLAGLIGLIAIGLWNMYARQEGLGQRWQIIDYTLWASPYLWMPMLYLYTRTITRNQQPKLLEFVLHALPSLTIGLLQIPLHVLVQEGFLSVEAVWDVSFAVMIGLYVQMAIYFRHCFRLLNAYDRSIREQYSDIASINLIWLRCLTGIFAVLIIIDFGLSVTFTLLERTPPFYVLLIMAEVVAIFAIGYFSLFHPALLSAPVDEMESRSVKAKYATSSLNDADAEVLSCRLKEFMNSSRPYLNNELRLHDLAEKLSVTPHNLSQVINQHCGKNFYDFVNEYRVLHAAKELAATLDTNITRLAFDSGFNNRVSFNNAFRKHLSMTPSAYRRKHRGGVQSNLQ